MWKIHIHKYKYIIDEAAKPDSADSHIHIDAEDIMSSNIGSEGSHCRGTGEDKCVDKERVFFSS